MATKAFVVIETAVEKGKEIAGELRQLEGVKSVDTVDLPLKKESSYNVSK